MTLALSDASLIAALDEHYATNIGDWLENEVVTIDEAEGAGRKPWPSRKEFPAVYELVDLFEAESMVFVPKSRRMMASWAVAAWCTWRARYREAQAIFIQSESQEKAAFIVHGRCEFIERHLRTAALMRPFESTQQPPRLTYIDTGSYIHGIAQGAEKLRTYTPSIVVMDESDFQQEGEEAFVSALPTVEKGARLVLLSTSNGPSGVLAKVCAEAGFTRWN